jgi:hypothetical protein
MLDQSETKLADDLLVGARAIGEEIGESVDVVYYLHRTGKLPIGKLGKILIATRSGLRRAVLARIPK